VSAEWADEWADAKGVTHKDVLRGAALTVRPYFKDPFLRPLVASEDANLAGAASGAVTFSALPNQQKEILMRTDTIPASTGAGAGAAVAAEPAVTVAQFAELQQQFAELKTLTDAQDAEIKVLTERNAKLENDARAKRFNDEVYGRVEGGVRWAGESDRHIEFLGKLAVAFGEDSEEFRGYVEQQRGMARQIGASALFKEAGKPGVGDGAQSPTDRFNALVAQAREEEPGLSYSEAFSRVAAANRQLYEECAARSVIDVSKRSGMRVAAEGE
jgi:hypothetical protein